MYKAKILSIEENKNNPDQISVTVEYINDAKGGQKQLSRQYDWISSSVNENTIELTVRDELKRMSVDTPTILTSLLSQIGREITL